jgi:SprT protein
VGQNLIQLCLELFSSPKARTLRRRVAKPGVDQAWRARAGQECARLGLDELAKRVTVRWNSRMRSSAGRATWPGAVIELNPALREIGEEEIERTFLHELAHLIAFERAGRRRIQAHGAEWRRACAELGIPGESASHRLDLPSRTMQRKWVYICPKCWVRVERVRRMRGHMACWPCCRQYGGGDYDERFKFIEKRLGS